MQRSPNLHFQVILHVDLGWPLTLTCDLLTPWTYEGFHIISINQVWFKSYFNFSNEAIFTFSAYLTTWPQMTFDLDMWPLTPSINDGSHVAPMTQRWLKSIQACGRYSQMLTCFHNNNSGQSDPYVSFLLMQATQKLAFLPPSQVLVHSVQPVASHT